MSSASNSNEFSLIDEFLAQHENTIRETVKQSIISNNQQRKIKRKLTREELLYIIDFLELDTQSDWDIAVERFNYYRRTLLRELTPLELYVVEDAKLDTIARLRNKYESDYNKSKIQAGFPCGSRAAGDLGEPSTQMVLNSFHTIGQVSIGISGVPR
jgi:hypothetical protein